MDNIFNNNKDQRRKRKPLKDINVDIDDVLDNNPIDKPKPKKSLVGHKELNDLFKEEEKKPVKRQLHKNLIEKNVKGVGSFGGICYCPDGNKYEVGDNEDNCGSLACINGNHGPCFRVKKKKRAGIRVTCANSDGTHPEPKEEKPVEKPKPKPKPMRIEKPKPVPKDDDIDKELEDDFGDD